MKIWDKISQFFFGPDEYYEKEFDKPEPEPEPEKSSKTEKTEPPPKPESEPAPEYSGPRVLDFNSAASNRKDDSARFEKFVKSEIKITKPKDYGDARNIADLLCNGIAVIINLEETDSNEAQHIVDFVSGTVHAIKGKITPAAQRVFICSPNNVTVATFEENRKSNFID